MDEFETSAAIIYDKIKNANNILTISARPADQDCIGSALTMKWWIKEEFGKNVRNVIFAGITDRLLNFPNAKEVEFVNLDSIMLNEYDLIITLDGSTWSRVFTDKNYKEALKIINLEKVVCIDHHEAGDIKKDLEDRCLEKNLTCTSELIYEYFIKPSGKIITPQVATWMLFGLIDDTKRFLHEVYDSTFTFANFLRNAGGDYVFATDESSPIENIKFTSWAIDNTDYELDVQATFLVIDKQKQDELEISFGKNWNRKDYDRHYVETVMRKIHGFNYGFIIQQSDSGVGCRLGWRTRSYGNNIVIADVLNRIGFNAGGHFGAGGGFSEIISIKEAKNLIMEELRKEVAFR